MISSFPSWFISAFSICTGLANPPKDAFCAVESSDNNNPSFFSEGAMLPIHKALGSLFFSNNKSTTADGVFHVSESFKFLSKAYNSLIASLTYSVPVASLNFIILVFGACLLSIKTGSLKNCLVDVFTTFVVFAGTTVAGAFVM